MERNKKKREKRNWKAKFLKDLCFFVCSFCFICLFEEDLKCLETFLSKKFCKHYFFSYNNYRMKLLLVRGRSIYIGNIARKNNIRGYYCKINICRYYFISNFIVTFFSLKLWFPNKTNINQNKNTFSKQHSSCIAMKVPYADADFCSSHMGCLF